MAKGDNTVNINGKDYYLDEEYKIEYKYDKLGRKIKTINPKVDGKKIAYDQEIKYDRVGNKLEVKTGDKQVKYTYDPETYQLLKEEIITPDGDRGISYTYDKVGNKLTETNSKGELTRYEYDNLYRLSKITKADGSTLEYDYDRVGNKIWEKDGRGNITEYFYNSQDQLTEVYEATIDQPTVYEYDLNGNLTKKRMSNGLVTEYRYNKLNQMTKEIRPDQEEINYSYDKAGKLKEKINRRGIKEEYFYYANNQLEEIKYYSSVESEIPTEIVNYSYDQAGNQTLVEKNNSSIRRVYDVLGRIITEERGIGAKSYSSSYKYDLYGNLTGIKYPNSNEYLEYNYDSLGQLESIAGIAGSEDNPAFEYNNNGMIKKISYANGVETDYEYYTMNRPQSISTTRTNIETVSSEKLLHLDYEYDGEGNVTRRNNNTYEYDALNRLVKANVEGDFYLNSGGRRGYVLEDYNGDNGIDVLVDQISEVKFDYNAGSIGVAFDQKVEQITKLALKTVGPAEHRVSKGTLDIYYSEDNDKYTKLDPKEWEYEADIFGNITMTIPQGISAKYIKVHTKFDDRDVEFEAVDKSEFSNILKHMIRVYRREEEGTITYTYDSVGNRMKKELITGTVESIDYEYYDGTNRLMTNGEYAYKYDEAGNLIKKGNKYIIDSDTVIFTEKSGEGVDYYEYDYNLQNRLNKVTKNGKVIAEFLYDANGMRIKSLEHTYDGNVKETNYVYNIAGKVIFEDDISKTEYTSYIFALGKQFAKIDGIIGVSTKVTYFHQDNLGSTRLMTNASGKVVMDQDYLPFGGDLAKPNQIEIKNNTDESYKYTGQKQVVSIGLYYYGARYYDPSIGRFTREDTYRGELDQPQSQHLYVYVMNNPLRYIDPTGHTPNDANLDDAKEYSQMLEELEAFRNSVELLVKEGDIILGKQREVQEGDMLSKIVAETYGKFGVNDKTQFIAEINNLEDENKIYPGQKIFMPDLNGTMYDYQFLKDTGVINKGNVDLNKVLGEDKFKVLSQALSNRSVKSIERGILLTASEGLFKLGLYVNRYSKPGPTMTGLTKAVGRTIREAPKVLAKNTLTNFTNPVASNALIDATLGKGVEVTTKNTLSKSLFKAANIYIMMGSIVLEYTQPVGDALNHYSLDQYSKYGIYKDNDESGYRYSPLNVSMLE